MGVASTIMLLAAFPPDGNRHLRQLLSARNRMDQRCDLYNFFQYSVTFSNINSTCFALKCFFSQIKTMKNKLEQLAAERNNPCVSISLNTHRTHPDNISDDIELKKLLKEAEERVIAEFGKRSTLKLLEKLETVGNEIDSSYGLDSLHIFLSNETKEIIKSPWPIKENSVQISDTFSIKPLIKQLNRTENYLILLLSQSEVKLLHAMNDGIVEEITNDDFQFHKNIHYFTHNNKLSDGKRVDNLVREFLNTVDKAMVKLNNDTDMNCVVICTEDNYSRLMQVADKPSIYLGYAPINYNDVALNTLASQAWKIVSGLQKKKRTDAIIEMQEAVGQGNVITDLSEIYRAVKEGRGDLLITHDDFQQPVKMTGEFSFDLADDASEPGVIDDISSEIAWEVISKKGRALFTGQAEIKTLGDITLKVRY